MKKSVVIIAVLLTGLTSCKLHMELPANHGPGVVPDEVEYGDVEKAEPVETKVVLTENQKS